MKNSPEISIVIRTYNSAAFVREAIDSALQQTLSRDLFEIVVVDDGSTDSTPDILNSYGTSIRAIKSEHKGATAALNLGLSEARGTYLIALDHDDHFEPDILKEMHEAVKQDPGLDVVYSDYYEVPISGPVKIVSVKDNIFNTLLIGILFKKQTIRLLGGYDETLKMFPEYDLIVKLQKAKANFLYIPKPLFTYRRSSRSITGDALKVKEGLREIFERHGMVPIRNYLHGNRIVFIGCRGIGLACLRFLLEFHLQDLAGIFTLHPDLESKTAGFESFEPILKDSKIPAFFIQDINSDENIAMLKAFNPDLIIQVGWSQIIKDEILSIPRLGVVGFHSSLLPKDRGGSPVNWAIIRGEKDWGTTLFYLEPGVDNGDIISQEKFEITPEDTCATAYEKAGSAMVALLRKNIPLLLAGAAPRIPQDESQATYNPRRKPADGIIDWSKGSLDIYNWIRALTHPYPGAFSYYDGERIAVWQANLPGFQQADFGKGERAGKLLETDVGRGVLVKTGDGSIILKRIQAEGQSEVEAVNYKPFKSYEHFSNRSSS